ncbi:hypothetical protein GCM10028808_42100 [Spirosoma migulaei]
MPKKKSSSDQSESTSSAIVPIVAIGASAGGMEAMTELLEHLSPMTRLAYVYIQHLDSNFDSQLASILGRATTMPVRQAKHLMRIEPDHVYVIPPNQDIEVVDGLLTLQPRQSNGSPHMPIDRFFIALADRQKEGSIGVLLSGMANDGTLGLRAIKVAGGITFAQDETARFQSMPKSAISENVVDRVLSPIEIAHELELLSGKPELFRQTEQADVSEDDETDEDIKAVILLLRRAVGVDFGNYKITTIRRRIIRRMLLFKLETLKSYANYIKQHPDEMELLYNDLLINVTTFFRDPETMDYLLKVLFPRIIKEKGAREPIRIWVPACSTGQEAYSLAILLIEALGDMASSMTIQVFATDLSEAAVAKARMGSYTKSEVMDVSARRLQRFFTKTDDHYRINRAVRDLCVFAPHNLLKDPPFSRLDFVSCRNLLIYLGSTYQRKAISMFHYGLNPNGYLLLGKSETVGSLTTLFAQVEKNYKIYIRKNDVISRASFEMNPRPGFDRLNLDNPEPDNKGERFSGADAAKRPESAPEMGFPVNDLEKTIDDLLLRQYVPASVVVNDDLDILRFRGSTSTFLEPSTGKASLNLLKMARPSLVFELRNTVHKARKAGQPVRKTGLEVKIKDKIHQVAIEVVPLKTDTEERLYLVLFEEVEAPGSVGTDLAEKRNRRIKQLEEELATLREDMRSIVEEQEASNEELQSANEEIISSNEELQSINEELETSKEEIESTNEELLTINQELQVRNDQLSEANEFSEVIFATIREATLVLDEDLRVKSANKTFYKLFRVDEDQTQGRLIYELGNRQWDIPALRLLLTDVIRHNVQVDSFEVAHTFADIGEKILLVNARRIVRNQEAILLAIEDITEHRRAQRLLAEREAWLHNLVENAPVLIWVSDANGYYTFFNKAWINFTGHSLANSIKQGWEKDIHPDDQQSYLTTYKSALAKRLPFQVELRLKRFNDDYKWVLLNASPMFLPGTAESRTPASGVEADRFDSSRGIFNGYIVTCAEIYNHKTLLQALDFRAQQRMQKVFETNAMVLHAQRELAKNKTDNSVHELAQNELQQHENQFRELIESTSDVITRWAPDLKLLYANSAFEQKIGKPKEELVGKTNQQMGQPDEIALPYMNKLQRVFDTKQPQSHYNTFPTPNGISYFFSRLVPEIGPDGNVQSVLAIAQDISDLNLVEEIQQTAFNLQGVLDSSPAAIGLLHAIRNEQYQIIDFELVVCNQKFSALVHQPIEHLAGMSVSRLADALWGDDTFVELEKVLLTNEITYKEQHETYEDGDRWLAMSLTKHDDGVVITSLDVTALKKAEQQQLVWLTKLEQSNKNLATLDQIRKHIRTRGELLRSTSHDLRGNFGIIQGAASLLDMANTDEERNQMLAMLQRNLKQATQMLTELLDFSRLEAGQEERQIDSFDASNLLNGLVESVQPLAHEQGLWLKHEGTGRLIVQGDRTMTHRIAQNLLLNALRYTKKGGVTVEWGLADDQEHWQFTIKDTGPGLPTGNQANQGEGIGLSIVRQLCELLNGHIEIDSQSGIGTRFMVLLPRQYER